MCSTFLFKTIKSTNFGFKFGNTSCFRITVLSVVFNGRVIHYIIGLGGQEVMRDVPGRRIGGR